MGALSSLPVVQMMMALDSERLNYCHWSLFCLVIRASLESSSAFAPPAAAVSIARLYLVWHLLAKAIIVTTKG